MKCPKCNFVSFDYLTQCKKCGASLGFEGERPGLKIPFMGKVKEQGPSRAQEPSPEPSAEPEPAAEVPHAPEPETEAPSEPELEAGPPRTAEPTVEAPPATAESLSGLGLRVGEGFDRLYGRLKYEEDKALEIRLGGFFRRAGAFLIDFIVLFALSFCLVYFSNITYSMGLAVRGQPPDGYNFGILLLVFFVSWVLLGTVYFILLHGRGGRTVGKWVLGLRVVAAELGWISYRQALTRWLGYFLSFLAIGLGFLWVLFSREKRAWHDYLAGTWVIHSRDPNPSGRD